MTATLVAPPPTAPASDLTASVARYWNDHIHDLAIVKHPIGTKGFFDDLAEYRYDKLDYLPRVVDFNAFRGKRLLEVGCGAGIDLVRFAQGGARVTGVDLSSHAIELARKNVDHNGLQADLRVMDGEKLSFPDDQFDVVYAHGVLQYTADAPRMLAEMKRVLRPGGQAIVMVYNRVSWLNLLSHLMKVGLEHADAPVLRTYAAGELHKMLSIFPKHRLVVERFPVKTRLHKGLKGALYNTAFVGTFNAIPRPMVRRFGWHIMGFAEK